MYLPGSDNKSSSVHEGVCDILACQGADGILRATPFIVKFATCEQGSSVNLWVNGEKTDVVLKVNDKLEGYFELTQQEYYAEGLSKGDITRVNQKSINDFNVEVSNCAQDWANTPEDQKADLFERNLVTQEDIAAQSGSLVGANKLIYKLGDEFYSEVDAWKAILNAKIGGVELPTSNSEHSPKKKDQGSAQNSLGGKASNDKLINAFRPSNSLLKRMNLRMGENDLTYEYFISAKATDKINVKIFLYPHDSRIVISDIDGTITKSDVLGIILPAIGINWHYHDLVSIFKKIKERGYNLVYLTARTFSDYSGTRKYIEELGHKDHKLPRGPILMYPKSFINVLRTDLVTKTADVYKTKMLEEVQRAFKSKECIVSGFGNQVSDAVAYKNIGIHGNYNFNIKESIIYMLSGKYKFSMEAFFNNVDTLFPETNKTHTAIIPDEGKTQLPATTGV